MAKRMNRKSTRKAYRKSRKATRRAQRKSRKASRMNRRFFGGFFQGYGTATATLGNLPPSQQPNYAPQTASAPPGSGDMGVKPQTAAPSKVVTSTKVGSIKK